MNIGDMLFGATEQPIRIQGTIGKKKIDVTVEPVAAEYAAPDVEQEDEAGVVAPYTAKTLVAPTKAAEKPVYNTYEDYDYGELLTYAGIDTYVTSKTVARMFPSLIERPEYKVSAGPSRVRTTRAPALIDIYQDCTQVIFDFICDLELAGINYDVQANRQLDVSMREEVTLLEDRIFTKLGKKVNLDSSDVMSNLLYGELGFQAPHKTKSGADATDGGALLTLAGLDPMSPGKYLTKDPELQFLADIAKRKNLAAVHRGFISTYMDDYLQPDGRVHALYNQFGTSTFRLSSSNPNLQNIPRAFGVKRCFNARPGYVFMCFDFSSAEVKILAAICRDEGMLRAVNEGLDFHSFSASGMFGIPYEEFVAVLEDKTNPLFKDYKDKRQSSKALTFGILYGSSAGGVANTLNVSIERAEELISMYFKAFPGVKTYIDQTHAAALHNRYVTTPFGHRRQFYGTNPVFKGTAAFNAALRGSQNYVIQSSTSVIGAIVFSQINREIKALGGVCTATVHDSLEAEVPIEHAARALEIFFYYMNEWPQTQYDWLGLSIGCEGEVGWNWAGVEGVHRGTSQEDIEAILRKQVA